MKGHKGHNARRSRKMERVRCAGCGRQGVLCQRPPMGPWPAEYEERDEDGGLVLRALPQGELAILPGRENGSEGWCSFCERCARVRGG